MNLTIEEIIKITGGKLIQSQFNTRTPIPYTLYPNHIVTDSRLVKSGDLFVALSGRLFEVTDSSHDGHDFLKEVFKNGAAGVIVSCPSDSKRMEQLLKLKFKFIIQVKDTLDAYQAIALYWREKFNIPVIAITGSNGKTTTKNMVTAVVEKKYRTLSSLGGFNNQVGVPASLLRLDENHQVAVFEAGTNRPGEMKILNSLIKPTMTIITNIGPAHLKEFKTLLNIAKEKSQLLNGADYAILNQEDDFFDYFKSKTRAKILTFGGKDFYDQNREAAQRVGEILGIDKALIKQGLESYEHPKMRMEEIKKRDFTILNDAYNANPVSMLYALKIFSQQKCSTAYRIAVLGDMLELGLSSKKYHDFIGQNMPSGIGVLITVGDQARRIADIVKKNHKIKTVAIFKNNKLAASYLRKIIKKGDLVLLKASRGMKFEEIVNNF